METENLMGALYIQKPNGEAITIFEDGTELREQMPLEIDWCDKCQRWQPLTGGYMVKSDGLALIWLCEACK
jgi:hypothetical protein